jgi:hypothetical protein
MFNTYVCDACDGTGFKPKRGTGASFDMGVAESDRDAAMSLRGYKNKEHRDAAEFIFKILREGEERRRTGAPSPYSGADLRHSLHAYGWVREDLRLALIKADPKGYGKYQS